MKAQYFFGVVIFLITGLFADGVQPTGAGITTDPYQVSTLDNLLWVSTNNTSWNSHFIQTADIDASPTTTWNDGEGWSPIGDSENQFTGTYNGNDHTIDGLYLSIQSGWIFDGLNQGFFGSTFEATIENLGVTNVDFNSYTYIGALIGTSFLTTVTNCYSTGTIISSEIEGTSHTDSYAGGLIGKCVRINENAAQYDLDNRVTDCYSTCDVTGFNWIGGLIGAIDYYYQHDELEGIAFEVANCYSSGYIYGKNTVGGLVGSSRSANFINCYSTSEVVAYGQYAGGLVGKCYGYNNTMENCYSTGAVICNQVVGGLIGYSRNDVHYIDCFSTGEVSGDQTIGGLIGNGRESSYTNCYSTGNVNGTTHIGGLFGKFQPSSTSLLNCYYNYESVQINGEHIITTGGLDDTMYNEWISNDFTLNIDDYLTSTDSIYIINSVEDLKMVGAFGFRGAYNYSLESDINLSNVSNFYIPYFWGEFQGNNHTIDNLNLDLERTSYLGLFGIAKNATIANLEVVNVFINGDSYVGGIAGSLWSTDITGCNSSGVVNGSGVRAGGLAGEIRPNTGMINCTSTCNVSGGNEVGGLAGHFEGYAESCKSSGDVSGNSSIGGLIGSLQGHEHGSTLRTSSSSSSVIGNHNVGGLTGSCLTSFIYECYSTGKVVGIDYVGGLTGSLCGYVGPEFSYSSIVRNSFSTGDTQGENFIGGLIGITAYPAWAESSYCTGAVNGSSEVGGLIGGYSGAFQVSPNSFWNLDISGQTTSASGTGLTTTEMQLQSTFTDAGWDFEGESENGDGDIWKISPYSNNGYPYLVENCEDISNDDTCKPVPIPTALNGNFPNPFNPETTIKFSIKHREVASLEIFNIKGQKVKSFGNFVAGSHEVVWKGKNDLGKSVSSGVFFYRLKSDNTEQVRKMLLLK